MKRVSVQRWGLAVVVAGLLAAVSACGGNGNVRSRGIDTPDGLATLYVNNVSNEHIHFLYLSSSDDNFWGPDLLGTNVVPVGSSYQITGVNSGYYDIRVVDASGNTKEWYDQYVAAGVYDLNVDGDNWSAP